MTVADTHRWLFALMMAGVLTGCQKSVSQEVDEQLANIHAAAVPVPIAKHPDEAVMPVHYEAKNDPFVSPFHRQKDPAHDAAHDAKPDGAKRTDSRLDDQKEASLPSHMLAPVFFGKKTTINPHRHKEPLEQHPLASLRYQGRVERDGEIVALVMSPDGVAHPVQIGRYLGENHGKITHISRDEIRITEALLQADGQYYERKTQLVFSGK